MFLFLGACQEHQEVSNLANSPLEDLVFLDNLAPGSADQSPLAVCENYQKFSQSVPSHRMRTQKLEVPLDWKNPNSEKITVGYHMFIPLNLGSPAKVLMYFNGGPGMPAINGIENFIYDERFSREFSEYQVIFMDQRGTGGCSTPYSLSRSASQSENITRIQLYGTEAIIRGALEK